MMQARLLPTSHQERTNLHTGVLRQIGKEEKEMIQFGANTSQAEIKLMKEAMETISFMEHTARQIVAIRLLLGKVERTLSALNFTKVLMTLIQ